jgi:hypothetical protein
MLIKIINIVLPLLFIWGITHQTSKRPKTGAEMAFRYLFWGTLGVFMAAFVVLLAIGIACDMNKLWG